MKIFKTIIGVFYIITFNAVFFSRGRIIGNGYTEIVWIGLMLFILGLAIMVRIYFDFEDKRKETFDVDKFKITESYIKDLRTKYL